MHGFKPHNLKGSERLHCILNALNLSDLFPSKETQDDHGRNAKPMAGMKHCNESSSLTHVGTNDGELPLKTERPQWSLN